MRGATQLRCFTSTFGLAFIISTLSTLIAVASYAQVPTYVPGTSEKLYQLTGSWDIGWLRPTASDTWGRYHVYGTDLGISTMYNGVPYFLFGDTWFGEGHPNDMGCIVALTMNPDPEAMEVELYPIQDEPGVAGIIRIPGLSTQSAFEVPVGTISYNQKLYMAFASYTVPETTIATFMCSSSDGAWTWTKHYELSDRDYPGSYYRQPKFIHVAMELVPANTYTSAQMPYYNEDAILMFGSGNYRASDVYLAVMPADGLETLSNIRYFDGMSGGNPVWTTSERNANSIIDADEVGELSVTWHEEMGRYILLYGGDWYTDPAVKMRTSTLPWEGWSSAQVLYKTSEACVDGFINCNNNGVHDEWRPDEPGGLYAPYIIDPYSKTNGDIHTIYYTLSTWNPYQVVLAKSDIRYSAQAPVPPGQATNPNPQNEATDVSRYTNLSWTAGSGATSHRVYFGTSNPPPFVGEQTATSYNPPGWRLPDNTWHYWRIDEVNQNGTTAGVVWRFRT